MEIEGGPELAHDVHIQTEEVVDEGGYNTEWDSSDYDSPHSDFDESDSDGKDKKRKKSMKIYPIFNPKDMWKTDPDKGLRFTCIKDCKNLVTAWAVRNGYQINFPRSCSEDLKVACQEGCPFWIYCSKMSTEDSYQIKAYTKKHTCISDFHVTAANSKFLATLYQNKIMKNPKMKLRELKDDIQHKYGLRVHPSKCAKVKKICLGEVENILKAHYAKLWDYSEELKRSNPGTTVKIDASESVFERMYICFEALKRGWKCGCRSVIGLDGAFLKGFCKGELMTAVGRDANNQMYPIAWAVVSDGENKDSWTWFLDLLMNDLDLFEGAELTLISDQQKGLVEAIHELLPKAEHRNCARHIYANFRKKFGGAKLKKLFWKSCKTGNKQHHSNLMLKIKENIEVAFDHLQEREPKHFSRAFFQKYSVCEAVENNMCEVLNAVLLEARGKTIIQMLEDIRLYMMERIVKRRNSMQSWDGELGPRIRARIDKGKKESRNWLSTHNGNNKFEVKHIRGKHGYTVDMVRKTCSCGLWELSGIPCVHAITSIYHLRDQPENYVSEWYHINKMEMAYFHSLEPINGEALWVKQLFDPLKPPRQRRLPGRPKKSRRKEFHEDGGSRVSRVGRVMHCGRCGQPGHMRQKCTNPEVIISYFLLLNVQI